MAIQIERKDHSAAALRVFACGCDDTDQARRLLAIALVLEGSRRTDAARAAGMDRQTLCDWVHRYNADGVEGLRDRPRSGRPALMSEAQWAELDRLVEKGPDVAVDGVVRWRCIDLRGVIGERFGVEISERSVGRILNARGFRRLSPRPFHPKADEAAQEAFKKTLRRRSSKVCRSKLAVNPSKSGFKTKPGSARREA